ncbi:MAG: hypothetical protein RR645_02125 [Clostridium sp.]
MIRFTNTRDTAKAVVNELNSIKKQFSAKPSERASKDKALWTISKGGESICFKTGKYAFMQDTNDIYCGVCIEKGLSKELSEYYPKSLIMTEEWFFKSFITKLRIGEIKKVLNELLQNTEKPIYIDITGSTPGVKLGAGASYTKFQYKQDSIELVEQLPIISDKVDEKELVKTPNLYLNRRLSKCTTLAQIADVIHSMDKSGELNFIWLDIFIWIPFSKQDTSLDGVGITQKGIIDLVLMPLNKCIN